MSLDRKDAKIKSLETSLRDQSRLLFPEDVDTDVTTEDPSSIVKKSHLLTYHN